MASPFPMWRTFVNINKLRLLSTKPNYPIHCCCVNTKHGVSGGRPEMEGGGAKAENISKAMKAYLERAKRYEKFMEKETAEYEMGRRHLARIMGVQPEDFTKEDIDKAISYLLPSGIFDRTARPMLKHPDKIVPHKIVAQFGSDGRPFHHMFYTGFPSFYSILHELGSAFEEIKQLQIKAMTRNLPEPEKLLLAGSVWLDEKAISSMLNEPIDATLHRQLITLLERIADHPWGSKQSELVMKYRKSIGTNTQEEEIPELLEGENGRLYMTGNGGRKTAKATVTIWDEGEGHVSINGEDLLTVFPGTLDREQVMFPLQFCGKLGRVDFEATLILKESSCMSATYAGHSALAGALRLALARALRSFVSKEKIEQMRLAGLLTRDPRMRERKKFGQEGARKKFTWKKR